MVVVDEVVVMLMVEVVVVVVVVEAVVVAVVARAGINIRILFLFFLIFLFSPFCLNRLYIKLYKLAVYDFLLKQHISRSKGMLISAEKDRQGKQHSKGTLD